MRKEDTGKGSCFVFKLIRIPCKNNMDKNISNHQLKMQKKRKERKKRLKKKIVMAAGIVLGIAAVVGSVIYAKQSQDEQSHEAFAKYGETEISKNEYIFFYNNFVSKWIHNNYDNLETYGLDLNKSFDFQIYNKETNETWADYFEETVKNFIATIYAEHEIAVKENYEDQNSLDNFISSAEKDANSNKQSLQEYVHENYSDNMSVDDFKKIAEVYTKAVSYDNKKFKEFEEAVTDEDIEKHYKENKNVYDIVTYKSFMINTSNTNEATDEEKKQLKKEASAINKKIKDEKTFNSLASAYTEGEIVEQKASSSTGVDADLSDWIYDEDRNPGDFSMIKNESGTIYQFVLFISRTLDRDKTVSYRSIYKKYKLEDSADDENAVVNDELEGSDNGVASYNEAKQTIQKYADEYTDSPKESTIEKIAEQEKIDNNGLCSNVYKSQLNNKEVSDWLWDESRKEKDIKIIEDKDNGYIYLFYWIGDGEPYYKLAIKSGLATDNYNEWLESLGRKTLLMLSAKK